MAGFVVDRFVVTGFVAAWFGVGAWTCILDAIYMPSGKLASLSFWNFRVFAVLSCSVIYTVSCVPVTKVSHIIPCFSIRWKSKGLFIKCLTLILSWSSIVMTLGKLVLFLLKVTLTSFQSISNMSHM